MDRFIRVASALFASLTLSACIEQSSLVEIITDPTGPLITTKSGGSATFTMYLSGLALGSAIVELQSTAVGIGQPVPSTLYFAQDAWRTPQQVTIVGLDDGIPGNENYALDFELHGTSFLVAYTQASKVPLQLIAVDDVAALLTDIDTQPGEASVDVSLRTTPQEDVTVNLASAGVTTLEPNQLVFTPDDASVAQNVNVTFARNVQATLTLIAVSDDPRYSGLKAQRSLVPRQ